MEEHNKITAQAKDHITCYGWSAIVFDVNSGGVILNVNNECQRSAHMSEGVQQSEDEYHKGIVGGAVQAQSMTMVIEGM
jgi:hypothetical protein